MFSTYKDDYVEGLEQELSACKEACKMLHADKQQLKQRCAELYWTVSELDDYLLDKNKFALELKIEAFEALKDEWIKKASEMPQQLECRSKGSSCYNWAMYYARELTDKAEQLRKEQSK